MSVKGFCFLYGLAFAVCGAAWAAVEKESPKPVPQKTIAAWCEELKKSLSDLKWKIEPCEKLTWQIGGHSIEGRPLVYAEFGDPSAANTTLIFSAVHSDEITPLYLGIQLAHWLQENVKSPSNGPVAASASPSPSPSPLKEGAPKKSLENIRVIVAPFVNPDGFFKSPRTRMNARGVDLNRNFNTLDWNRDAIAFWKKKFKSDRRRFPGNQPSSEPETVFQEELIKKLKPTKILSIHAPLNFLDYDGPSASGLSLQRFSAEYVQECLKLRKRLKARSSGYFTGSLGNYAGQQLGIPTLTLELPSADSRKAEQYWKQFSQGIQTMIQFKVPSNPELARSP